jgi:hypothetical protein
MYFIQMPKTKLLKCCLYKFTGTNMWWLMLIFNGTIWLISRLFSWYILNFIFQCLLGYITISHVSDRFYTLISRSIYPRRNSNKVETFSSTQENGFYWVRSLFGVSYLLIRYGILKLFALLPLILIVLNYFSSPGTNDTVLHQCCVLNLITCVVSSLAILFEIAARKYYHSLSMITMCSIQLVYALLNCWDIASLYQKAETI